MKFTPQDFPINFEILSQDKDTVDLIYHDIFCNAAWWLGPYQIRDKKLKTKAKLDAIYWCLYRRHRLNIRINKSLLDESLMYFLSLYSKNERKKNIFEAYIKEYYVPCTIELLYELVRLKRFPNSIKDVFNEVYINLEEFEFEGFDIYREQ